MRDAYWELRKIGGTSPGRKSPGRNPVVLGRRYCIKCGRWRHCCDFGIYKGGFRGQCHACARISKREWLKTRSPEQRARTNEYWRIWSEAKGRSKGTGPRAFRNRKNVIDKPERILLPPGPVLEMIGQYLDTGGTILALADASGVSYKTIQRLLTGESRRVRLDAADKLAVAFGLHLDLLYDEEAA